VSHWPELQTFSLSDNSWLLEDPSTKSIGTFENNLHLHTLTISKPICWSTVSGLLVNLPPSLRTLHLIVDKAFYPDPDADFAIDRLVAVAPSLQNLQLGSDVGWRFQPVVRGLLDRFVAKLANVERLTIPACAVTNLVALLSPLPRLAKLCLRGTSGPQGMRCEPRELAELVAESLSLRSVVVGRSIFDNEFLPPWIADDQDEIERAAKVKGVEVVWE
jgi:hypothetical protein